MSRLITLLTDFGTEDGYVGAMKGRIFDIYPQARIVDISHTIPKFDVRAAAFSLANYFDYFPENTIHVVVVDPGVGGQRRALAIKSGETTIITPDNGIVSLILRNRKCDVFGLRTDWVSWKISGTFHGRDLFAPAAAELAKGTKLTKIAEKSEDPPHSFIIPVRKSGKKLFKLQVLHVDHFGNVITNLHITDFVDYLTLMKTARIKLGKAFLYGLKKTYSDVKKGECLMLWGSSGFLEIAQNQGNASLFFNVKTGDELILELT